MATSRGLVIGAAALIAAGLLLAISTRHWRIHTVPPELHRSLAVRDVCSSVGAVDYYFPTEAVCPFDLDVATTNARWISGFLAAAKQESLSCGGRPGDALRVTHLNWNASPQIAVLRHHSGTVERRITSLGEISNKGVSSIARDATGTAPDTAWN